MYFRLALINKKLKPPTIANNPVLKMGKNPSHRKHHIFVLNTPILYSKGCTLMPSKKHMRQYHKHIGLVFFR